MCSLFRKFIAASAAAVLLAMPMTAHATAERFTDITIDKDTDALELVMKDKPTGTTTTTTVPNTGDFGWIAVLAVLGLSLLGAGLAVFFGRKK